MIKKILSILVCLFFYTEIIHAQSEEIGFRSVDQWPMPKGKIEGLTNPGFNIVPRVSKRNHSGKTWVVLNLDITFSTPQNPLGGFSYRYLYNGKIYTDQMIGTAPFQSINSIDNVFKIRVQGPNINKEVIYDRIVGGIEICEAPADVRLSSYSVHMRELVNIVYSGENSIINAIKAFEASITAQADQVKRKEDEARKAEEKRLKEEEEKRIALQQKEDEKAAQQSTAAQNTSKNTSDDFWNDKPTEKSLENVIPNQHSHANLPDLVRTTDGGYYQRGSDGQFREINQDDYYLAKNRSRNTGQEQKKLPTQQEIDEGVAAIMNSVRADQNSQFEMYDNIDRQFDQLGQLYQQNYYTAEAVRTGKANLEDLSTISGNNNSIQEIENEFNRKNSAIRAEVNRMQEARNTQAANAVAYNYTGTSSTEQAIGAGIQTIANMVNAGAAQEEEREAREALKRERDRQIAAFEAAQLKARIEVRQNLVNSFPNGGTPITSHKVTEPEVYLFAYFVDEASFPNQNVSITVSNVFSVYKYDDGTFPYVTSVSSKLKGFGTGKLVLVGYYLQKAQAEKMYNSFINLAKKSDFSINKFAFGVDAPTRTGQSTTGDFWETGKTVKQPTKKSSSFWDN
jgi:hypothetical protein